MGDHYCCIRCTQRYEYCKCYEEPTPRRVNKTVSEVKTPSASERELEDIKYFHDKLRKYQDLRSAVQLQDALASYIRKLPEYTQNMAD